MMREGIRIGPYVVEAKIGAGGLATVWRAHQSETGEVVALKILNARVPTLEKRMVAEARMQGRLHHPNVVHVFGLVYYKGAPVLVMEYVRGPSLAALLAENKQLPLRQVQKIGADLLRGLAHAHDCGFVHRDVKPSNVLLGVQGDRVTAKLCDFGIAKAMDSLSDTETDVTLGSLAYMAPEQIRDTRSVDERADVYGAGLVLYELLTGRQAFAATDIVERYAASAEQRFQNTRDLRPDAPDRLHQAIKRALIFDLDFRPASAGELLGFWQSDQLPAAPPAFSATDMRELSVIRRRGQPDPEPPSASKLLVPTLEPEADEPVEPSRRQLVLSGFIGGFLGMLILYGLAQTQLQPEVAPAPQPVAANLTAASTAEPETISPPEVIAAPAVPPEKPAESDPIAEASDELAPPAQRTASVEVSSPEPTPPPRPTATTTTSRRPPSPKPEPKVEAPPPPPKPRPSADTVSISVDGVDKAWLQDTGGTQHGLAAVPGNYELWVEFNGTPTRALAVELRAGQQQSFKCVAAFKVCKAQ